MKIAIVSDIHANLQAWRVVLTDIAAQRAARILSLGDSVGYGANPAETLESLYRHVDAFCLGNHDAAACGKLNEDLFQPHAQRLLRWTRTQLSHKAARFLETLPLTLAGQGFRCAHGDFVESGAFRYVEAAADAARNFQATTEPLLFVGHTHVPALFVTGASGTTHHLAPQDFVLEPGKRYLINPGSVGSPRSGDAFATYCIYDDAIPSVVFRAVPFDLDASRAAMLNAGFTAADSPYLELDPRCRLTLVREYVSFSPPKQAEHFARDVVAVNELSNLRRSTKRWQKIAGGVVIIALLAVAAAIFATTKGQAAGKSEPLILPHAELAPVPPAGPTNLLPPFPPTTDGASLAGWRVTLDNPLNTILTTEVQGIGVTVTKAPARFRIESPPITISRDHTQQVTLSATWHKNDAYAGHFFYTIEQLGDTDNETPTVLARAMKEPPRTKNTLQYTTKKGGLPKNIRYVRLVIEGEHRGAAIFEAPTLRPIP